MDYSKLATFDFLFSLGYVTDGARIISESRGGKRIDYVYGKDGLMGFYYAGEPYLYERGAQGDVLRVYDRSGSVAAEYAYDAYGNCEVLADAGGIASLNPFRYRGYYFDAETGLYYLNARYYDPRLGRFLSPDSLSYLDPSSAAGTNLFAYCQCDPVNNVDPSGNDPVWWNPFSWDWEAVLKGVGLVLLGVGAIVAGVVTLPFGGWAAVMAGVTILAGAGAAVFGMADTWEGMSGYNGLLESVFMGNKEAYDITENIFKWVAIVGTIACGIYGLTHTTVAARSIPARGTPNGGVLDAKHHLLGYYGKDGVLKYSLHLTNHGNSAAHALIHWHLEMPHSLPINNFIEFLWDIFGGML